MCCEICAQGIQISVVFFDRVGCEYVETQWQCHRRYEATIVSNCVDKLVWLFQDLLVVTSSMLSYAYVLQVVEKPDKMLKLPLLDWLIYWIEMKIIIYAQHRGDCRWERRRRKMEQKSLGTGSRREPLSRSVHKKTNTVTRILCMTSLKAEGVDELKERKKKQAPKAGIDIIFTTRRSLTGTNLKDDRICSKLRIVTIKSVHYFLLPVLYTKYHMYRETQIFQVELCKLFCFQSKPQTPKTKGG